MACVLKRAMKCSATLAAGLLVFMAIGCDIRDLIGGDPDQPNASAKPTTSPTTQHANAPERLFGTWQSIGTVDTPLGAATIRLTFRQEGPVRIVATSTLPLLGQLEEKSGPYYVENGQIISDTIRGGTAVDYWFEGDNLAIEYKPGEMVRFIKTSNF